MATSNLLTGSHVDLSIFIDGVRQKQSFKIKTWSVTPNVTKFLDSFGGDPFDHPDQQIRSYGIKMELYRYDAALELALMAREVARQSNQVLPVIALGVTWKHRDGTFASFIASDVELPPPDTTMGGAAERVMNSIEGVASKYAPAVGI